jgi:predicted DsbA family dithiol-disulfide isomerase
MPAEGMERRAYIEAKFGGSERARTIYDTVRSAGASEGITFAFDRIRRTPSTLQSHRLMRFATAGNRQDATLEALFRAYFIDGRDIGDRDVLADIAVEAGLDRRDVSKYLASDSEADTVIGEDALARRAGINGVPCFIFNGRFALSGAQEPEAFFQLFDLAREDEQMGSEPAVS